MNRTLSSSEDFQRASHEITVERLARQAGISEARLHYDELGDLVAFAALVAEECAKIAERHASEGDGPTCDVWIPSNDTSCASMIRRAFPKS